MTGEDRKARDMSARESIAKSDQLRKRMESLVSDLFVHLDAIDAELIAREVQRHDKR